MPVPNGVVLLTCDHDTVANVTLVLQKSGRFELAGVPTSLSGLVRRMEHSSTSAVLVDIDPGPVLMLEELESIIARFPGPRYIVISSTFSNELMIEAMQAGARYFLVKRAINAELSDVLDRLVVYGSSAPCARGQAITVLSASGGCGSTTLACNLANELGIANSQSALLVDMDPYGAVAPSLGMEGQYGVADVLSHNDRIDGNLIHTSSVVYSDTLHVLLSPASINLAQPMPLHSEYLGELIEACKDAYAYAVIDAPRVPMDIAATLVGSSCATLLVFQLTVKDIHIVRSIYSALIEMGVETDKLVLVVNRHSRRNAIGFEEAQNALGGVDLKRIRNDYRNAVRGLNYGQPLSQVAPSSALRNDVRKLAEEIESKQPTTFARS